MQTVVHIGPSKTASTSLQAIIPHLGRPYQVKPTWAKPLSRQKFFAKGDMPPIPQGSIVSDECIGDFDVLSPSIIANRIWNLFGPCIVIYVKRETTERLISMYNYLEGAEWARKHESIDEFAAFHRKLSTKYNTGFFVADDVEKLRQDFEMHDFRVLNFDLLKIDPQQFLAAFCAACAVPVPNIQMPHLNEGPLTGNDSQSSLTYVV